MDARIEALLPFYALDALTAEERAEVEAYLTAHPEARAEAEALTAAAGQLAYMVEPVTPPPALKRRLMARVQAEVNARPAPKPAWWASLWPRLAPGALAASLAAAVLALGWALALNQEVAQLRIATRQLQARVADQDALLTALAAPGAQLTAVTGTPLQPKAHGSFITDAERGTATFVAAGLAPLAPGQVYQFWLIRDGVAVGAGLFQADAAGRAVLTLNTSGPEAINAVGVSVEPAGGSAQPSEQIVLFGELS